jgi:hypothetical protein
MRKAGMLAATAAMVGSSMLIGAPAQAASVYTSCSTGFPGQHWNFNGGATYSVEDGYQHWNSAGFTLSGATTSGSSNVNIRLRTGVHLDHDPTHWSYNSPDTLDSNVQYSVPINTTIPASELNYLKFHAIFDVSFFPDPSCTAYVNA